MWTLVKDSVPCRRACTRPIAPCLGIGNALWRSLIDFNCDGLAVYSVDCALVAKDADLVLLPEDEHEEPLAPLRPG